MKRLARKIGSVILPVIVIGLFSVGCVEAYWPDLGSKYDKALVVDGMITNQAGPYTVKLSLSTIVGNPEFVPVSGYQVQIIDDIGNEETMTEVETGVYQTDPSGIQGVVGRSYKIIIISPEDGIYESDFEELRLPTGIDSVYATIEYGPVAEFDHELPGYQFYIDTHTSELDINYYLWKLEETYEYNANHTLKFIYDGQFHTVRKWDSLYTCWTTARVFNIFTYKTDNLSEARIEKFPLNFVATNTKELSVRYSLKVKQLSITRAAFSFWNDISKLETEQETLYTRQPFQIRGNVSNRSDVEEPVLGYFMAAGVTEKRIFVNRPMGVQFYYNAECELITEDLRVMLWLMRERWPALLTSVPAGPGLAPALPTRQRCIDCQQEIQGGKISPPDFWIEY